MWSVSDFDVGSGETKRVDCPICNSKKTFTITNNMGSLVWNCYKASCNVRGGKKVSLTVTDIKKHIKDKEGESKSRKNWDLPDNIVYHPPYTQKFTDRWSIPNDVELMYDVKEDRVVFTIHDNYRCVDAIGRSLINRIPKWKRYGNSDLPYTYGCGSVAVVVEDCVSAVAVSYTHLTLPTILRV